MDKKYKVVKYYKGKMLNTLSEHNSEVKAKQVCSIMNKEVKKITGDLVTFKVESYG